MWKFDSVYEVATKARAQLEANVDKECCSGGLTPAWLIRELREHNGEDDIVALDNGLYKVWFARNYQSYKPDTLLLDNALATMGAGYSSAMMAKILYPERQVIAVVGDGGLMMNLGDVATIVKLKLDITIVILNDQSYGMIKRKQKNM
jgi:acetolactate synthase-1/2/3 large subunit